MFKLFKSFGWAASGLRAVWREEPNFRIEIAFAILVILLGAIFDISRIDWIFLIIAIAMVLCGEIVNTAIEDLCNKVESGHDKVIGHIKDIMAGFVLLSSLASAAIGIIIFSKYIF